jgi:hypothetical protein
MPGHAPFLFPQPGLAHFFPADFWPHDRMPAQMPPSWPSMAWPQPSHRLIPFPDSKEAPDQD